MTPLLGFLQEQDKSRSEVCSLSHAGGYQPQTGKRWMHSPLLQLFGTARVYVCNKRWTGAGNRANQVPSRAARNWFLCNTLQWLLGPPTAAIMQTSRFTWSLLQAQDVP